MKRTPGCALLIVMMLVTGADAGLAQSLRAKLSELFVFGGDCGLQLCLDIDFDSTGVAATEHGRHFLPKLVEGNAAVLAFVDNAVGRAVANIPVFATIPEPIDTTDAQGRLTRVFPPGPIFSEIHRTLGKGWFFLGFNITGLHLSHINGQPTDNLEFNFAHEDVEGVDPAPPSLGIPRYEVDLLAVRLALDMDVIVATGLVSYGVSDHVDVGVSIPLVRTTLSGRSEAQIIPLDPTFHHRFGGSSQDPILRAAKRVEGSQAGLGDIGLRAKIGAVSPTAARRWGLAVLADLRLPTGDEDEFLGAGSLSARALAIASARYGNFAPHANLGYLLRSGDLDNDAAILTAGFTQLLSRRATLVLDLLTEWQLGRSKLTVPEPIVFDEPTPLRFQATTIPDRRANLVDASVGLKFQLRPGTVLVANAIVPMRNSGFRPDVIWTLGVQGVYAP